MARKHGRIELLPHQPGSDYHDDRNRPGHTLWPQGICISGLTMAQARRIEACVNVFAGMPTSTVASIGNMGDLANQCRSLASALELAAAALKRGSKEGSDALRRAESALARYRRSCTRFGNGPKADH